MCAALLTAVALGACGQSGGHAVGRQLSRYLASVNRVEKGLDAPLNAVDDIDRQLAGANRTAGAAATTGTFTQPRELSLPVPEQERQLRDAQAQVTTVIARLDALAVPGPAAHLQSLIVSLATRQRALITQTELLAAFAPGYTHALAPLAPAVTGLKRVLADNQATTTVQAQILDDQKASALRRFAAQLQPILTALARLRPPSSSVPTYRAQRRSLSEMQMVSQSMAHDLNAGDAAQVQADLRAFDRASALPSTRASQLAERTAIRAYDNQITGLRTLAEQADVEREKLARRYAGSG